MLRILSAGLIATVIGLTVWGLITLYDANLQVGRMWETPRVNPHEQPLPVMDTRTVPVDGGENVYRLADPAALQPPFELTQPVVVTAGQQAYQYYCIQCHGKYHDGLGTVGQSFAPLPGDLRSAKVQSMPVGQLFYEISYGIPGGRQPALASTISPDERWQIIAFVKSLGQRP
jgi:mono/diheme cytochrome c family protein